MTGMALVAMDQKSILIILFALTYTFERNTRLVDDSASQQLFGALLALAETLEIDIKKVPLLVAMMEDHFSNGTLVEKHVLDRN